MHPLWRKYIDEDIENDAVYTYIVNPNIDNHSKFLYLSGS